MITPENVTTLPLERLKQAYRTAVWAREMVRDPRVTSLADVKATKDFVAMLKAELDRRAALGDG